MSSELKLKINGRRVTVYLTFRRDFEISYDPGNVVVVDVNENNVTIALFEDGVLVDVYRIETNLGRIVIAYAERRRRITVGKSTMDRGVRKSLEDFVRWRGSLMY